VPPVSFNNRRGFFAGSDLLN